MDRFSWTSSSTLCVLPGESGIHRQSGVRIYDGDKKVIDLSCFETKQKPRLEEGFSGIKLIV